MSGKRFIWIICLIFFSHGDRVFDFFIVPSGSKMNARKPARRQVFLHSNLFLFSFAFLYLKRLQIIRHIQITMIILLSFLRIQLLSLRQMCLFCMIQQQIRRTEFFRKLACFFYCTMMLLIRLEFILPHRTGRMPHEAASHCPSHIYNPPHCTARHQHR